MKRIITILAVLVLSIPTYAQLLWPIKGTDAGNNIISRPQHYVDRELNFDELFIAADEGIEVISPSDGTIVSFGINYLHNLSTSTSYSVESTFDQAITEVKAEAGHITAMSELGSIYYYGEEGGVEKDIQKSFDWSMKAARQGDYKGRYNVAYCYKYGKGVAQNKDSAIFWVPVNESSNGL